MTNLSPAARAVLKAACIHHGLFNEEIIQRRRMIAAALRAAADQVVPPALEEEFFDRNHALPLQKMVEIRLSLLAIADELEGKPEEPKYLAENLAMFNPFDPEKRL